MMERIEVFTETRTDDIVFYTELQSRALNISKSQGYG